MYNEHAFTRSFSFLHRRLWPGVCLSVFCLREAKRCAGYVPYEPSQHLCTAYDLDSKANKWPEDYVADFLPLFEKFRYQKGSLMQSTLETQLDFGDVHDLAIQPLPPMQEYDLTDITD